MKQLILIKDENNVEIGSTFPRRAKQLVSKEKAFWLDDTHREIVLAPKKSFILNAYRDNEEKVISSTPLALIKKSKRRTRELHTAFSMLLWLGAAIIYFGWNYLLGNRVFSIYPSEWSSNWLVFVFAALIECCAEIYFCKNELAVLNENIDLRQINPMHDDKGLLRYQQKLTKKIRVMSSAAIWLPLVLLFFIIGYAYGVWSAAWFLVLIGVFMELLMRFVKKFKSS